MEDVATRDKIIDLPTYPNAFIGRTHHIQFINALLKEPGKRLITLLGPGGMGKTRLSVKIGQHMVDHFQHGVCFVALETVADPAQVPLYIGHRLGLKANFAGDWMDTVIDFLYEKHLLLILDNLEQILPFARQIDQLLEACPRLKILVTSREVLGLTREIEYPLDSLNRPNPRLFPRPEDLIKFDAIDLFVQKAKTSRPDFELNEDNAVAVVRICQELDGLPLPIELAAARIKLFSPKIILQKLNHCFDLLKSQTSGVATRHQNIRNTVQWSYDLLEEDEQQLFRQLALFRGGFTLDSLEATCPGYNALEAIDSFINKSLIIKDKEVEGIPRFRMLKLIRDYGLEQLQQQADRKDHYQRFANYYLSLIEADETRLQINGPARWMTLVEAEYENLETALEWLSVHQARKAARLGTSFWRFYLSRGFLREGLEMIKKLLSLRLQAQDLEARLLEGAGTLSHNLGNYRDAGAYFTRSLEIWETIKNETEIIKMLNNLGWIAWRIGNYDQTIALSEKALELSHRLNDDLGQAKSLNNIAWIHLYRGACEQAEALQRRVLAIYILNNDLKGMAFARTNLASALIRSGKFQEARQMIHRAIDIFSDLKNQQLLTFARTIQAEYHFETGDLNAAEVLLQGSCLPSFEKIGDIWGIAQCHYRIGRIAWLRQEPEAAGFHLNQSMEYFRNSSDKFGLANTGFWWSQFCREQGDHEAADAALDQCLVHAVEMKICDLLAHAYLEQASQGVIKHHYDRATQYIAVSYHYAKGLVAYQYNKFEKKIKTVLEPMRQSLTAGKIGLTKQFDELHWQIPKRYQTEVLDKIQLQEGIRELLCLTQYATSSEPETVGSPDRSGRKTIPVPEVDPFVMKVRQVIELHISDPKFKVKDLCREMAISHSQLHRKLSESTGHSAGQFIRFLRIERAKQLLKDPQLTVTAVAYDTGFRDTDYFYRVFKQMLGITPGEFRRNQPSSPTPEQAI